MALKDLLVKAGLVVADDSAEREAAAPTPAPSDAPMPPAAGFADLELGPAAVPATAELGSAPSFEAIYATAAVPSATYPAERLLKVLDGLRAMEAPMRRAAVSAMDEADDGWKLDDVLGDAARKVLALRQHLDAQQAVLSTQQAQASAQKTALTQDYDSLRSDIAKRIAELQEAAQQAASEHAQAMAALDAQALEAATAVRRETLRVQTEIERLESIAAQLGKAQG